jgi:hypothetical protein
MSSCGTTERSSVLSFNTFQIVESHEVFKRERIWQQCRSTCEGRVEVLSDISNHVSLTRSLLVPRSSRSMGETHDIVGTK